MEWNYRNSTHNYVYTLVVYIYTYNIYQQAPVGSVLHSKLYVHSLLHVMG